MAIAKLFLLGWGIDMNDVTRGMFANMSPCYTVLKDGAVDLHQLKVGGSTAETGQC